MMGGLAAGAVFAIYEDVLGRVGDAGSGTAGVCWAAMALTWCLWSLIFFRLGRRKRPEGLCFCRQKRTLLAGSILELLIAVPTHIAARNRELLLRAGFFTLHRSGDGDVGDVVLVRVRLCFFLFVARWEAASSRPPPTPAGADDH